MFDNRKYMIFSVSEIESINFSEVVQKSSSSLRISIDGTKTLVKWEGVEVPSSVDALITKQGPYSYEEILAIMETSEWTDPNLFG